MRKQVFPGVLLGALLLAAFALSGCASDPLADQYRAGSGKNYVAGDGAVTEYPRGARGEPVTFSGTTSQGGIFNTGNYAGDVLVVNFWYAACAPCRAESPVLRAVSDEFVTAGARFVGVNVRDSAETAASFETEAGLRYPSILDSGDGAVQLAFAGKVPANAVPTTIVLDRDGRVAARILGQISDASILSTIVRDVLAESA